MMQPTPSDPVIDELREIRHQISAAVDHDPARLLAYYMKLQEEYRDRLIGSGKAHRDSDHSPA
jgi:hypothetical protein